MRHAALAGGARLCSGNGLRTSVGCWHAGQTRTSMPVCCAIKATVSVGVARESLEGVGAGARRSFATTSRVFA
jgi:hypothetical protein